MDLLDRFDLDLSLEEAALAPEHTPTQRMLANACIGMDTLDAFYAVAELRQAAVWVHEGVPQGKRKLAAILGNDAACPAKGWVGASVASTALRGCQLGSSWRDRLGG